MALSEDQKAMLRLLVQREQGYEDLAALMGLEVEEVRAKVADALAQLDAGEAIPEPAPKPAAPAEPPSPPSPAAPPQVDKPASTPPSAEEPPAAATATDQPAAADEAPVPGAPPPSQPRVARRASAHRRLTLPAGRGARAAIAAGAAALVALIVVLALGVGGSGSNSSGDSGASGGEANPTVGGKEVTEAHLEAVDGSGASGVALFGRVKNSLALQVEASGLAPLAKGEAYTVWIAQSPQRMLPLASTDEVKGGRIAAQFSVPTEVLGYLAAGTFNQLELTRTRTATLEASLKRATRQKKSPSYTGEPVLRGTITGPIVGAAKKQQE